MKFRICLLISACLSFHFTHEVKAQPIIYGTNNFVEYQVGTLPLVISVAHGGNLEPASIPNRTCNNAVTVTDAQTIETALAIKNYLFAKTGCYPHLIINNLKRTKLDPNRNISDAACGNPQAETAFTEFHNFITTARNAANQQFNNNTFFVDLHGHGNSIQRIELGYLLYDDELELSDSVLNTQQYVNYSSIGNLALSNLNNYSHAELLRGQKAFGTLLENQGYPAVPSQIIPFPGTNSNYFSGGYITVNHTCYTAGININGLQMELNFSGIRDTHVNRTQFAMGFSEAMLDYLNTHFQMNWNNCTPLSADTKALDRKIVLYPNPISVGEPVYFNNILNRQFNYVVYNIFGQVVKYGQLTEAANRIQPQKLSTGLYFIHLQDQFSKYAEVKKLVIN